METKSPESDGDSNPIPCPSVILWIGIPETHQDYRLDQNKLVDTAVEVIKALQHIEQLGLYVKDLLTFARS
jgi:hypothetical protein